MFEQDIIEIATDINFAMIRELESEIDELQSKDYLFLFTMKKQAKIIKELERRINLVSGLIALQDIKVTLLKENASSIQKVIDTNNEYVELIKDHQILIKKYCKALDCLGYVPNFEE